jgi:hypothetical protein
MMFKARITSLLQDMPLRRAIMEVLLQGPILVVVKCIVTFAVRSSTSTWDLMRSIKIDIVMENIKWTTKTIATTIMAWMIMKFKSLREGTMSVAIAIKHMILLLNKSVIDTKLERRHHNLVWTTA